SLSFNVAAADRAAESANSVQLEILQNSSMWPRLIARGIPSVEGEQAVNLVASMGAAADRPRNHDREDRSDRRRRASMWSWLIGRGIDARAAALPAGRRASMWPRG